MVLTPAERRAVLLVVALLALGTLWDARPLRPRARRPEAPATAPDAIERAADSARVASSGRAGGARLDLNRATLEDLVALPGVGPVLAGRILEQRRRQGGFRDVRDLRGVRGIGPRLYARLEPYVAVPPRAPEP